MLKQKIVATMQQSYPGINPSITGWKGQEITDFQEDLLIKVNAHISEKWFYNHIKTENKSLPRVDVLNLLSRYVGYANWDDFVFRNGGRMEAPKSLVKPNRYFVIVPLIVLVVLAILVFVFRLVSNREYRFSFYDAHTREVITGSRIEIKVLSDKESPVSYFSDTNGNFILKTNRSVLKMVASAPYYHADTITRILKTFERDQLISLRPDDYAMIIHYFSESGVEDWQKRRSYLSGIIDDGAMIYQVFGESDAPGMELYNKEEFIDRLTVPAGSLKYIDILDVKFKADKIFVLRFRINKKSK